MIVQYDFMPSVSALLKSIQHPSRRQILNRLKEADSAITYTELLPYCEHSTGKLNYHIRTLSDIILKTESGYLLSQNGHSIVTWLNKLVSEGDIVEAERPTVVFSRIIPPKILLYKMIAMFASFFILPYLITIGVFMILGEPVGLLILGLIVLSLLGLLSIYLYYHSIWYQVTDTEVIVHKGVITRTEKIVPFRTVTNIEIKRGPFDRLYGIGSVKVHTAGSSNTNKGAEEDLMGLISPDEIKETILERMRLLNPPDFTSMVASMVASQPDNTALKPILDELRDLNQRM